MTTGGIFTLVQNDGRQDKMLMATSLLNRRLKEIRRMRCRNPAIKDTTPTLVDIEKTHILYMNAHFKPFAAIAYEYDRIGTQEGLPDFGSTVSFSIPQFGDFFHDMCIHVILEGFTATVPGDQVQYCEYPGHRLAKQVEFEVNRNILDEYDSDVYNFHYNFFVPEHKRKNWLRNVGQEIPRPAVLTQNLGVDPYREQKWILDGPQTPKGAHPRVEMWIPLLFWFNKDPRLAIPSVSIPFGQRFITVELATVAEMCFGINNGGGGGFIPPQITQFELYINNIFVNPEIHDIFIKRVGFSLIRVHRFERRGLTASQEEVLLDSLRWPVETLYFGVRPTANITGAASQSNWHKFHISADVLVPYPVAVPNPFPPPADQLAFSDATYKTEVPILQTVGFRIQAVELYRQFPVSFYNSYIPYTYGGPNVGSPDDPGMYMATFNLYPGSYQPSGHINLSQSREFYFIYTSRFLNPGFPGNLFIVAITINFLLITDGGAVLRFNT
jgi:hypothetical protein